MLEIKTMFHGENKINRKEIKKVEVTRLVRKFGTIDKICNRRCQRMVIMKRHGSIADQKMFQLVLSGHYLGESPGLAQGMGY